MGNVVGGILMGLGLVMMFVIWLYTTVVFFGTGETVLALISLLVPPADLVLPFLISPWLGVLGLGGTLIAFIGAALRRD